MIRVEHAPIIGNGEHGCLNCIGHHVQLSLRAGRGCKGNVSNQRQNVTKENWIKIVFDNLFVISKMKIHLIY